MKSEAVLSDPSSPSGAPTTRAEWEHKDEWRKVGRDFLVTVYHHERPAEPYGDGPHRWNVYAYIYPKHPYFAAFDGPEMFQPAATAMPFHAYPSLLEYPMYEGKVTSVKVGSDYHHLHDSHYTHYATKDDAQEIFEDAEALFQWLSERAAEAKKQDQQ